MKKLIVLCMLLLFPGMVSADDILLELRPTNEKIPWGLIYQKDVEFRPIDGEQYQFKVALSDKATMTFELLSADGDVVRSLVNGKSFDKGEHTVQWDGRDDEGQVVPDEVYSPRVTISTEQITYVDDPRRYSGGEILKDLEWTSTEKTLSYELPYPSRVLIRTGIKGGSVMRVLKQWEPSSAGKSVTRWDGYDKDQVEYFAGHPARWSVVQAYRIPQYAVISSGNRELNYPDYRKLRGWEIPEIDLSSIELQRQGVRLSKDYFVPRQFQPDVEVTLDESLPVNRFGLPVASDKLRLTVDVPKDDRWILDASFYETSFYIDYQFRSEEEQGFVPLVWDVDVSTLSKGRHIATVQLFGFSGFIVSDTVAFWVD